MLKVGKAWIGYDGSAVRTIAWSGFFYPLVSVERIESPDRCSPNDPFPAVLTATLVAIVEICSRSL